MDRLHVGLDRLLGIKRRAVAAAFHESDARHHRVAMQRVERVFHRLLDQAMDDEAVLVRVDVGFAAAGNDEVQAVRRDRAVEELMRRARGAAARLEIGIAQRAHHLLLEFRRLAVRRDRHAGRKAPRAVGQRLGCRAGERRRDARTHRAGDQCAAPDQRAAVDETIAGNLRRRIAARIPPLAHDSSLDRHVRSCSFGNGTGPRPLPLYAAKSFLLLSGSGTCGGCAISRYGATARVFRSAPPLRRRDTRP